ncbi:MULTISPECIES: succinyldiaminopimelate transaminase [Aeromicrobium]|uniref:succinyldiaminopimelate transaminase n=1 Tax=Aeromicrobium TaxID=2040 RepID=UPI00210906B3|nr:succinyldiaminopimelate transaminase [Aeromicrobium sp. 636]
MGHASVSGRFPDFPWDTIAPAKARAAEHPGGLVDLSIGTPVDPTPEVARQALIAAADSPGYPTVLGPESLRRSVGDWLDRRFSIPGIGTDEVLATIGSKELIANLCVQLGIGPGDVVGLPETAYPTYAVSAAYAGATAIATDSRVAFGPQRPKLVFINFPANPHGRVVGREHLKAWVDYCRESGALLVSDECYLEFVWEGEPVSVLDPQVNGGSLDGIIALHSLSKRSNMAGYRDAFVVGDRTVIAELLAVRKHLGFMLPTPVAAAMQAALADDTHVDEQRERYARRRATLRAALEGAGFRIDHSQGSLYLWATRDEPCRETVQWLAERGILVAPGDFYGATGTRHVRFAFTATDERIAAVAERLA